MEPGLQSCSNKVFTMETGTFISPNVMFVDAITYLDQDYVLPSLVNPLFLPGRLTLVTSLCTSSTQKGQRRQGYAKAHEAWSADPSPSSP